MAVPSGSRIAELDRLLSDLETYESEVSHSLEVEESGVGVDRSAERTAEDPRSAVGELSRSVVGEVGESEAGEGGEAEGVALPSVAASPAHSTGFEGSRSGILRSVGYNGVGAGKKSGVGAGGGVENDKTAKDDFLGRIWGRKGLEELRRTREADLQELSEVRARATAAEQARESARSQARTWEREAQRLGERVRELEAEKKSLEREKKEMEVRMRGSIEASQHHRDAVASHKLFALHSQLSQARAALEEEREVVRKLKAAKSAREVEESEGDGEGAMTSSSSSSASSSSSSGLLEKLRERVQEGLLREERLEREVRRLQEGKEEGLRKVRAEAKELGAAVTVARERAAGAEQDRLEALRRAEAARVEAEKSRNALHTAAERLKRAVADKKHLRSLLQRANTKLAKTQSTLDQVSSLAEETEARRRRAEREAREAKAEAKAAEKKAAKATEGKIQAASQTASLRSQLKEWKERLQKSRGAMKSLEKQVKEALEKKAAAEAEKQQLQTLYLHHLQHSATSVPATPPVPLPPTTTPSPSHPPPPSSSRPSHALQFSAPPKSPARSPPGPSHPTPRSPLPRAMEERVVKMRKRDKVGGKRGVRSIGPGTPSGGVMGAIRAKAAAAKRVEEVEKVRGDGEDDVEEEEEEEVEEEEEEEEEKRRRVMHDLFEAGLGGGGAEEIDAAAQLHLVDEDAWDEMEERREVEDVGMGVEVGGERVYMHSTSMVSESSSTSGFNVSGAPDDDNGQGATIVLRGGSVEVRSTTMATEPGSASPHHHRPIPPTSTSPISSPVRRMRELMAEYNKRVGGGEGSEEDDGGRGEEEEEEREGEEESEGAVLKSEEWVKYAPSLAGTGLLDPAIEKELISAARRHREGGDENVAHHFPPTSVPPTPLSVSISSIGDDDDDDVDVVGGEKTKKGNDDGVGWEALPSAAQLASPKKWRIRASEHSPPPSSDPPTHSAARIPSPMRRRLHVTPKSPPTPPPPTRIVVQSNPTLQRQSLPRTKRRKRGTTKKSSGKKKKRPIFKV